MKRKCDNLRTLWDRAAKSKDTTTTSVLIQQPQEPQDDSEHNCKEVENVAIPRVNPERVSSLSQEVGGEPMKSENEVIAEEEVEAFYDVDWLESDPGKRIPIADYDVNEQDRVRRRYVAMGACQPRTHNFERRDIGGMRRFIVDWYKKYPWLEYSVEKEAAFCFVCYLFKDKINCAGGDSFVSSGFRNWNQIYKFDKHMGGVNSYHSEAQEKHDLFKRPKFSVVECIASTSKDKMTRYMSRLTYSLRCLRFLLQQGLALRGHNERKDSSNRGNFVELLKWLAEDFEQVNSVVLGNAPKNCTLTSPEIQKDLINCCAKETTRLLLQDLGDDFFAILADESSDVYLQEQMALCLRYVDKIGRVVERFLGVVHVQDTTALTLKEAIGSLLADKSLRRFIVDWYKNRDLNFFWGSSVHPKVISWLRHC